VLGLTFTRKAAGELGERVRRRLRALDRVIGSGGADPLAGPTVSTYNAYAGGLVGEHALRLGVEPSARVIGDAARWQLAAELVESWPEDLGTDHYELVVGLDDILAVLPKVIYALESFDPSLVRSSVANYLISHAAREEGYDILLSGEGGDEAFCGYLYLKKYPEEQLFTEQLRCLRFLHNNAALRLDRMNLCNSLRVVAPLTSGELLAYALRIPGAYKIRTENGAKIEKWIFRKAYEGLLPDSIVWRVKQEFSQGSGSAGLLPEHFAAVVTDRDFAAAKAKYPFLRSKEEWYYFRLFKKHFGDGTAVDTVGQWVQI